MGMESKKAEIYCPVCRKVTLVVRRPRYEGLRKIGEIVSCSVCGTEFADEAELQFVDHEKPQIFGEGEGVRLCLNCKYYIVNPFVQRCTLTMREVEATGSCERFVLRPKPKEEEEKKPKTVDELKRLLGMEETKKKPPKEGTQENPFGTEFGQKP